MEDLFYFTKKTINLNDLTKIADEFGYSHQRLSHSQDTLNVQYDDRDFWQWVVISEKEHDFDSFEPEALKRINEYKPVTSFAIYHHTNSLVHLEEFLRRVFTKYDGWIGCDTGNLEPIYTLNNIALLPKLKYGR